MARVTYVKAARKAYPNAGIKKGESYFWWKFRYGAKHMQKTQPRRSQLTQSGFLSQMYDIEDRLGELGASTLEELEDVASERDSIVSELQDMASECEDKLSNMPDSLQQAPTGEMLQNRSDECNSFADDLENVDLDIEREEGESDDDLESRIEDAVSELQNCSYNGE